MWWKKRIEGESLDGPALDARIRSLSDALTTAVRRLDDVESAMRRMHVEWTDTLDRVSRMAGRVAKRAERAAAREDDVEDAPPVNGVSPGAAEALRIVEKRRSRGGWPGGGR